MFNEFEKLIGDMHGEQTVINCELRKANLTLSVIDRKVSELSYEVYHGFKRLVFVMVVIVLLNIITLILKI